MERDAGGRQRPQGKADCLVGIIDAMRRAFVLSCVVVVAFLANCGADRPAADTAEDVQEAGDPERVVLGADRPAADTAEEDVQEAGDPERVVLGADRPAADTAEDVQEAGDPERVVLGNRFDWCAHLQAEWDENERLEADLHVAEQEMDAAYSASNAAEELQEQATDDLDRAEARAAEKEASADFNRAREKSLSIRAVLDRSVFNRLQVAFVAYDNYDEGSSTLDTFDIAQARAWESLVLSIANSDDPELITRNVEHTIALVEVEIALTETRQAFDVLSAAVESVTDALTVDTFLKVIDEGHHKEEIDKAAKEAAASFRAYANEVNAFADEIRSASGYSDFIYDQLFPNFLRYFLGIGEKAVSAEAAYIAVLYVSYAESDDAVYHANDIASSVLGKAHFFPVDYAISGARVSAAYTAFRESFQESCDNN